MLIALAVLSCCQGAAAQEAAEVSEEGESPPRGTTAERPRLSDAAELDRVVEMYLSGQYQKCADELGDLLSPEGVRPLEDPNVVHRARIYRATCLLLDGRRELAKEPLRDALAADPLMRPPDSLTFPPPVVSLFLEVRDENQKLIERREQEELAELKREARDARRRAEERRLRFDELERLASQESVVVQNSRWLAAVPFGVGQFQNGDKALGWTFLVTETLLAGTALGAQLVMLDQFEKAADPNLDKIDVTRNLDAAHTTLVASSWAFVGVAVLGIAQAQWAFVPERQVEVRERPLPEHLRSRSTESTTPVTVGAQITPTPDGWSIGITGTF